MISLSCDVRACSGKKKKRKPKVSKAANEDGPKKDKPPPKKKKKKENDGCVRLSRLSFIAYFVVFAVLVSDSIAVVDALFY